MASTYTIKKGDTLDTVAKQLGVDSGQLASANNLQTGAALTEGNVLNVPAAVSAATAATPAATTTATTKTTQTASPYTGLSGLSTNTQNKLGQYANGYVASDSVNAAQQYLQSVINGKPGDYQSQYKGQLESLYNQVMNREPFTFDLNGDMLYNQYKDQYTQLGQQAMMDTMGQAATLTGGYGNSYAQTAGQQAYQQYLTQLNNIIPDLYQMAQDRYNQAGQDLRDRLSLTQGLEDAEYNKYRDMVSDWNTERGYASDEYWNRYNTDYANYQNMLNYWNTIAQQEHSQYNTQLEMAYAQAMAAIQAGVVPSSALLKKAGISSADAKKMAAAYKKGGSGGGGGGGGGGGSSRSYSSGGSSKKSYSSSSGSGSYKSTTTTNQSSTPKQTEQETQQRTYYNNLHAYLFSGGGKNASNTMKKARVETAYTSGKISASQYRALMLKLGK